jgi:hypothetical protein
MTRVLLTVDTALSWSAHARGESWNENLAGLGVPRLLDLLRDHGLKACFFVDPMPALVYGIEPIRLMVEPILAAGQDVQLHLHPVWQSVAEGVAEGARFDLTCYDSEDQLDLIETARELLVEAGAPSPVAFRSGGYAADVRTLAALLQAGLRFDSSHDRSRHPQPSALPLEPDMAGPADLGGLIEVPVTFQLGAIPGDEVETGVHRVLRAGQPLVTLAGDSFELAAGDDRFERLWVFLAGQADLLPTIHFTDLEPASMASVHRLPPQSWSGARRMDQAVWPNALYARSL